MGLPDKPAPKEGGTTLAAGDTLAMGSLPADPAVPEVGETLPQARAITGPLPPGAAEGATLPPAVGPATPAADPGEETDEPGLPEGTIVGGRYQVLQALGEGGMGRVYLALHTSIEKRVALKVLHSRHARSPNERERFLREAKAAARVQHPNVVDITDFGETDTGSVFIAMELLEGQTLASLVRQEGRFSWERARPVLVQIAHALVAAHAQGIIHRDIKPENVLLVPREDGPPRVKVVDFGIAKLTEERDQRRLTVTGIVQGTPASIAPEQIDGHAVDHRADVYGFGALMFRVLSGRDPFRGRTLMEVLMKHLHETAPPLHTVSAEISVPGGVEAIVARAMAKAPTDRYQTMAELAEALEAIDRAPAPSPALPSTRGLPPTEALPAARRGPAHGTTILVLAALVLAGGVVFWLVRSGGDAGGDRADRGASSPAHAVDARASTIGTLGAARADAGAGQTSASGPDAAARGPHRKLGHTTQPAGKKVAGKKGPGKQPSGKKPGGAQPPEGGEGTDLLNPYPGQEE